jgi:hypothetical protein
VSYSVSKIDISKTTHEKHWQHQTARSEKFLPVGSLPQVTEEFAELLKQGHMEDLPSCSLAEALEKQDLFINSVLAQMGRSLMWQLLRQGLTTERGLFLNLKNFRSQPLAVG